MQPTIVLTHGAFAESSSWNGVITELTGAGHRALAWANPLRGLAADATALSDLVRTLSGPVVLVGHSYGGGVVANVTADPGRVVALVFVAGFALQPGESCGDASSLTPGSTLGETLQRVPLSGGAVDTYIDPARFHQQFAGDLPEDRAALMAATQRPVTEGALSEPSGAEPLWRSVPSWFVFGDADHNIPVGAHRLMAERAAARGTVEIAGASHAVGVSRPAETAAVVLDAIRAVTGVPA